nr:hypothetical protein [Tanacetum cinerariifolium]
MKDNLQLLVVEGIKLQREKTKANIASMVADTELMNNYILHVHLTTSSSSSILNLQQQLTNAFCKQDHEDHYDDDARLEEESSVKRKRTSKKEYDLWAKDQETYDDEVSSEEVTPEFFAEITRNKRSRKRADLVDVYLDQRIVDIIRIQYDQGHGQEFMKEIVGKIADEIYQLKVNLTAPKLTFPGIREKTPYTIATLHFVGLIYDNINKEKRIMDIDEIPKFCDATLKRVLKDVKRTNLDVEHGYENPPLSDEHAGLMAFYKEYIQDLLRHRDQMRRWKRYVNERPPQQ